MKADRRKARVPPIVLFSSKLALALFLIALIALLEKGPQVVPLAIGAHPLNGGPLGLSRFYEMLSEKHDVVLVTDWREAVESLERCERALVVIVSPELRYEESEAKLVAELARRCREVALLVADETGNSNPVLEAFNLTSRISGYVIQSLVPVYIETPWGWRGALVLDKPSTVYSSGEEGFYAYETSGKASCFVIGDGSIFLNQVLESQYSEIYASFIESTVENLCGGGCVILLEASKYQLLNPLAVLEALAREDSELASLIDPVALALSLLSIVLHPATWLPPLLNALNMLVNKLLEVEPARFLLFLGSILLLAVILSTQEEKAGDSPLRDIAETGWYGYGEFRRVIEERGLSKEDFIQVYSIVDSVLTSTTGVSLTSPEAVSVLEAHGVSGEKARRYWDFMNKYYRRALGKTRLPPIVFWSRVVKRALVESEEVLAHLGASLKRLGGLEEKGLDRGESTS